MKKYQIVRVALGSEGKYLDEGYEPFGVVAEDTSYYLYNTTAKRRELNPRTSEYIYLRKLRGLKY